MRPTHRVPLPAQRVPSLVSPLGRDPQNVGAVFCVLDSAQAAWNPTPSTQAEADQQDARATLNPKYLKVWRFLDCESSGEELAVGRRRQRTVARRTAVTQQAVERALGKLLTDENFRERFFENPRGPAGEPASPSRRSSSRRSRECLDTRSSAFTTIWTSGSVGLVSIPVADLARPIAALSIVIAGKPERWVGHDAPESAPGVP